MPSTLALLAHPTKIDPLLNWLTAHQKVLNHYHLKTTADVAEQIRQTWNLDVISLEVVRSAEEGGDLEIAAAILAGEVAALFFYLDPLATQPPKADSIWRAVQTTGIPVAINDRSASLLLRGLAKIQVAYLIFNPVAGQGDPSFALNTIREALEPQLFVNIILTQADVDPAEQAREVVEIIRSKEANAMGQSLIIVSGGDGTVSAVAGATIGTGIPLGIIPRGTANAFANALGIPGNLREACNVILAGNTHVIDAARCNQTPMILLAGIGFEAGMVHMASRELKNELGSLAYILAGVRQLATAQPFNVKVEIEGDVMELATTALTVANVAPATSVLAQGLGQVIPDDGLLEVTIATSTTRLQSIGAVATLIKSATVRVPTQREDIFCLRTNRLTVTTDPPQKLVVDGEIMEANPIEFECIPRGLTVFVPLSTTNISP